jgi:hypothetical protein
MVTQGLAAFNSSYYVLRRDQKRKNSNFLRLVPHQLFPTIQDYLSRKDYRSFVNTHNSFDQRAIRRETIVYSLTQDHTNLFCEDPSFRDCLLPKISNPSNQLVLSCVYNPAKHRNIRNVEELFLTQIYYDFGTAEQKKNLLNFNLESTQMDVCDFGDADQKINILLYQNLYGLKLSHFHRLTSLSGLKNLKSLSLCHLSVLSDLSSIRSLSLNDVLLYSCNEITDVTPLLNIPLVTLKYCKGLADISTLGNHEKLSIESCQGIHTVHSLVNVKSLSFIHCMNLKKFLSLSNIGSLHLQDCMSITDVSSLNEIPNVSIHHCTFLRDVNPILFPATIPSSTATGVSVIDSVLKATTSLELVSCPSIVITNPVPPAPPSLVTVAASSTQLSSAFYNSVQRVPSRHENSEMDDRDGMNDDEDEDGGDYIRQLTFKQSSLRNFSLKVTPPFNRIDFEIFANINKIELHSLTIQDLNLFSNIPTVTLHLCYAITDVKPLRNCSKLVLSHCPKICSVDSLGYVPHLTLSYCRNVSSVDCLGHDSQKFVKIEKSHRIKSFQALNHVQEVVISDCQGFHHWDDFSNVARLTVDSCSQLYEIGNGFQMKSLSLARCPNVCRLYGAFPKLEEFIIDSCEQLSDHIDKIKEFVFSY